MFLTGKEQLGSLSYQLLELSFISSDKEILARSAGAHHPDVCAVPSTGMPPAPVTMPTCQTLVALRAITASIVVV